MRKILYLLVVGVVAEDDDDEQLVGRVRTTSTCRVRRRQQIRKNRKWYLSAAVVGIEIDIIRRYARTSSSMQLECLCYE